MLCLSWPLNPKHLMHLHPPYHPYPTPYLDQPAHGLAPDVPARLLQSHSTGHQQRPQHTLVLANQHCQEKGG